MSSHAPAPALPRRLGALALLALLSCTVSAPRSPVPVTAADARTAWTRVLRDFVREDGRIDFAGLARDPRDLLDFVAYVARADPERDALAFPSADARLAHELNAYNALAMYGVHVLGTRTHAGLRKIGFFYLRRYEIAGGRESLYAFEKRIRARGDARVHFALNCMAVSCPRLPRTPFTATGLQAQLEREAHAFFADPRQLTVDDAARTVRVSAILKFYRDDFLADAGSLVEAINRHRAEPIPADYRVEFLPYDWTINAATAEREAPAPERAGAGPLPR